MRRRDKFLAITAGALLVGIAGWFPTAVVLADRHASTWHPKAEDDYPACWAERNDTQPNGTEVICGPLWAIDPASFITFVPVDGSSK